MATLQKDAAIEGWIRPGELPGEPVRDLLAPPVVGNTSPLDPDVTRIPGCKVAVYVFDLSEEKELQDYRDVLNAAGQDPFTRIHYVERHWMEAKSNWKVLIEVMHAVRVGVQTKG